MSLKFAVIASLGVIGLAAAPAMANGQCKYALTGPYYTTAGAITYVCLADPGWLLDDPDWLPASVRKPGTGWYWAPLDGSKCLAGYEYLSTSRNGTSDLDICMPRQPAPPASERTDDPHVQALKALAPVNPDPLAP